jgi:hypothetical protein
MGNYQRATVTRKDVPRDRTADDELMKSTMKKIKINSKDAEEIKIPKNKTNVPAGFTKRNIVIRDDIWKTLKTKSVLEEKPLREVLNDILVKAIK